MKRKALIIAVLLCFLGGIAIICGLISREPSYKGRKLSEWIGDYKELEGWDGYFLKDAKANQEAIQALQEIGPSAVPFLTNWFQCKDSPLRANTVHFLNQHTLNKLHIFTEKEQHMMASKGFKMLGKTGMQAVPFLIRSLQNSDPDSRCRALVCLSFINPDKAVFLPLLRDTDAHDPDPDVRTLAKGIMVMFFWDDAFPPKTNNSAPSTIP